MRSKEQEEKFSNKTIENNSYNQITEKKAFINEIKENNIANKDQNIMFMNDNSFERFTKNSVFSYDNNHISKDLPMANGIYPFNINTDTELKQISYLNHQHNLSANKPSNNLMMKPKINANRDSDQFNIVNNQNIKSILEENEYLKNKIQKYEKKYIKHKSISKSYKKLFKSVKKEKEKEKGEINFKI